LIHTMEELAPELSVTDPYFRTAVIEK